MQSFDLRDTIIPFSLLQIANHFQRMKPGDEIEVIGNDPGIESDIRKILPFLDTQAALEDLKDTTKFEEELERQAKEYLSSIGKGYLTVEDRK